MAISEAFRKAAGRYTGTLYPAMSEAMEAKGYVFLSHSWINDGPKMPTESWEILVDKIGGEDAIEADFQEKDPCFTISHIGTGITKQGNGSLTVLGELWLALEQKEVLRGIGR